MSRIAVRLAKLFAETAVKAAGVALGLQLAFNFLAFSGRGEKLTPGEEGIVHTFFGDGKTADVRKHYLRKGEGFAGTVMGWIAGDAEAVKVPLGSNIVFFEEAAAKDYSHKSAQGRKLAIFMHEMTHEMGEGFLPSLKNFKCYPYAISDSSRYDDFGDEQRASMVADYILRFGCERSYAAIYQDRELQDDDKADSLLARVIEAEYPGAKILRGKADQARALSAR